MKCSVPLIGNKNWINFTQIFLNAHSSSFIINDRETNKTIFVYLFIYLFIYIYFSFELEIEKNKLLYYS